MSDDEQERFWLHKERAHITGYFQAKGITPPQNLEIAFSLPPKLALWSETLPDGSRQIWVISGDCPTDYLVFDRLLDAREAMAQFAAHWIDVSSIMMQGQQHPRTRIGDPNNPRELQELGAMLESRAKLLHSFAQRDNIW
jgi:hypothetical protein